MFDQTSGLSGRYMDLTITPLQTPAVTASLPRLGSRVQLSCSSAQGYCFLYIHTFKKKLSATYPVMSERPTYFLQGLQQLVSQFCTCPLQSNLNTATEGPFTMQVRPRHSARKPQWLAVLLRVKAKVSSPARAHHPITPSRGARLPPCPLLPAALTPGPTALHLGARPPAVPSVLGFPACQCGWLPH